MPRENNIVSAGTRELDRRGAWWFKTHGAGVSRNGVPDVLAIYRGRGLAIEFKQPGRTPTRLQQHELDRVGRAGGCAVVATSVDDVRAILDDIDAQAAA
jgi:Holliday junction resolvase